MTLDLRTTLRTSLKTLKPVLHDALVYLDGAAGDALAASTGLGALFGYGALNVLNLNQVSKRDATVGALLATGSPSVESGSPNVVVFWSELLYEGRDALLHLMKMHPMCRHFWIFCCYSVSAHSQLGPHVEAQNPYLEFEAQLMSEAAQWTAQSAALLQAWRIRWANVRGTEDQTFLLQNPRPLSLGFHPGSHSIRDSNHERDVHILSHALAGFASHVGRKLDVYALGTDAQAIGSEVMKMGVPMGFQELPPEKTAALVLIDRAFDLVAPLHHADTLLDRILAAVEAGTTSDDSLQKMAVSVDDGRAPLSLFAAEPPDLPLLMHHLLGRSCRDGSLYVRKWIREEIRAAGLRAEYKPKPGPPSRQEFSTGAALLKGSVSNGKRQSVRALCVASAKALDTDSAISTHSELLLSNERQILNLPSTEDLVQYFLDLLLNVTRPNALLGFEDVCCLLAFAYSILNDDTDEPFNPTEEKLILEALVQCALADHHLPLLERLLPAGSRSEAAAIKIATRAAMQERLEAVKKLASRRQGLKELKRLTPPLTPEHRPLVQGLVSLILQDKGISDLRHVTSALQGIFEGAPGTGLLSKGLGRLGLSRQPESAVGGHDLVIIFIVGGMSLHEIHGVAREVEENGKGPWKPKILFGSNFLLTPKQTLQQIWNL